MEMPRELVDKVVASLPPTFTSWAAPYPITVAGGWVRDILIGVVPRDLDNWSTAAYTKNKGSFLEWQADGVTVQSFYTTRTPAEVIESFDFICCAGAIYKHNSSKWAGECHPDFLQDAQSKVLRIQRRENLRTRNLLHAMRLVSRGYTLDPTTLAYLVTAAACGTKYGAEIMLSEPDLAKELVAKFCYHPPKEVVREGSPRVLTREPRVADLIITLEDRREPEASVFIEREDHYE